MNKFLSGPAENSIMDVGFPKVKDFCNNIVLKKRDICYNIKHG